MQSEMFWVAIWAMITIIIITIVLSVGIYWRHHNTIIAEMVADGVDPIAVMCALQDDYGNNPVCIALAVKGE